MPMQTENRGMIALDSLRNYHLPRYTFSEQPKVTVVIPIYNLGELLLNAVDSVQRQTLKNIEVLLVDDCSTDDSLSIAEKVAQTDPRIRAIQMPANSGGVGGPRNLGIREAAGRFILFLDGDDLLDRHALFGMYNMAIENELKLVCGLMERVEVESGSRGAWYPEYYKESQIVPAIEDLPGILDDTTATNKLYETAFLRENSFVFAEGAHYEDLEFTARAFVESGSFGIYAQPVYSWLVYPNELRQTITNQRASIKNLTDRLDALRRVEQVIEQHGSEELRIASETKLLKHHLRLYINDILTADDEFATEVLQLIQPLLVSISAETWKTLHPAERWLYGMVSIGYLPGVRSVLTREFLKRSATGQQVAYGDRMIYWPAGETPPLQLPDLAADLLNTDDLQFSGPLFGAIRFFHEVTKIKKTASGITLFGQTHDFHQYVSDQTSLKLLFSVYGGNEFTRVPVELLSTSNGIVSWKSQFDHSIDLKFERGAKVVISVELTNEFGKNTTPLRLATRAKRQTATIGSKHKLTKLLHGNLKFYQTKFGNLALKVVPSRTSKFEMVTTRLSKVLQSTPFTSSNFDPYNPNSRRLLQRLAGIVPLNGNHVLVETNMGALPADSPLSVVTALIKEQPHLKVFYSTTVAAYKLPEDSQFEFVRRNSLKYFWLLKTSKYLIDNQGFPTYFSRREGQVYLQTWHGTPLKRLGYDDKSFVQADRKTHVAFNHRVAQWSGLVAPNTYFENTLVRAFGIKTPLVRGGTPRNDILLSEYSQEQARKKLGINTKRKVILYAPTYRDDLSNKSRAAEVFIDLEKWVEELGDECLLVVRAHYLNRFAIPRKLENHIYDLSDHADINDIYMASDAVITDYSSVIFDFALTGRPVVIYAPDIEAYEAKRGEFYFDLAEAFGERFTEGYEQLIELVRELDYSKGVSQDFIEKYSTGEDGKASLRSVEFLLGKGNVK